MSLGAMDIFKFLPAGKKTADANCKKCGCATCMMFAIKASKGQIEAEKCPHITDELKDKLDHNKKVQQLTLELNNLKIGGETVLYRHEKTFINPTALVVKLDCNDADFEDKLNRVLSFECECIGEKYRVDALYLRNLTQNIKDRLVKLGVNFFDDSFLKNLYEVEYTNLNDTVENLVKIRKKAIIDRDEKFCAPTFVHLKTSDYAALSVISSTLLCKYANMLIFDHFNEALFTSLITLRINIFTDPQKPLQVESKVYEFNNPDENALVFLTTNFALSYFAVANELSSIPRGSYLVITPSEGMSVLTAWSAQKITAEIASKVVNANDILGKVKNKNLIIPGLLSDLREELQEALPEWKIVVGTTEAYKIPEFVKNLDY